MWLDILHGVFLGIGVVVVVIEIINFIGGM